MITNRLSPTVPGLGASPFAQPGLGVQGPSPLGVSQASPLDGGALSPEAFQPEAQINGLLNALAQAFAVQPLDPVTQLQQEIQRVEQQLQHAQRTGNQPAINSLERQLQQLMAQLQQLMGQQSEGAEGGEGGGSESASAPAPSYAPQPVTSSSPPSGNSSYGGGGGGSHGGGGGGGTGSSSGSSASASPSFALDTNYSNTNAEPGVEKMLERANSMVGLDENRNTAEIQKLTGKSGINPATTPWCAAFAMNLLDEHGVMNMDGLSNRNYCPTIKNWASEKGTYGKSGQYQPKPGDAILFDWEKDGTPDHIGIVEKVVNGKVHTIEGNSSNKVSKKTYDLNAGSIDGYVAAKPKKNSNGSSTQRR